MEASDLVFVPAVGFRPAPGSVLINSVVAERADWRVSIDHFVTGPEGSELTYALSGPIPSTGSDRTDQPSWLYDAVALRTAEGVVIEATPEGAQGRHQWSVAPGLNLQTMWRGVTFPPLPPGVTDIDLVLGGAPGDWTVPFKLTPITGLGPPAKRLDSRDIHHGVTIVAGAIASGETMTAVDLRTVLAATSRPRFMRSIGSDERRPGDESRLALEDDAGTRVGEFATFYDRVSDGRELHQVFVFPPLDGEAGHAVLTIPEIRLAEDTGAPVTLPIPIETDIELGRHRAHARVTRAQSSRGSVVRVELDDGGWHDDSRLVYAETVRLDGVTRPVGPTTAGPGDPVQSFDPSGAAGEITLDSPVVLLRGPWRLEIPL
jgi:hypothetical protein